MSEHGSAGFSHNHSHKPAGERPCSRCKKIMPAQNFRTAKGRQCSRCRDYDRRRYVRKSKHVKVAYYARLRSEMSFWEWKSFRLRGALNQAITAEWLASLWEEQRGCCALTGRPLTAEKFELDHIVPRSRGGTNALSNLRMVSAEANASKHNLLDEELVALCRDILRTIGQ